MSGEMETRQARARQYINKTERKWARRRRVKDLLILVLYNAALCAALAALAMQIVGWAI